MPDTTAHFFVDHPTLPLQTFDLFTDGSCTQPPDKRLRVATWGMAIWDDQSFLPLAHGGIPGRSQTSLRGEITGALSALMYAAATQIPCRIWVDNQSVFDTLTALADNQHVDTSKKADHDLWFALTQQFRLSQVSFESASTCRRIPTGHSSG